MILLKILKGRKRGFTLVEIIVVSVIVAILAMIAVQVYSAYFNQARKNVAENVASSAATFLNSASNVGVEVSSTTYPDLNGSGQWNLPMPSSIQPSIFKCPKGVTITVNTTEKTVKAIIKNSESSEYKYDKNL